MKNLWVILSIILLSTVCIIVYVYPKLDYSPVPLQWDVRSGWARYHIIHYGVLPEDEYAVTWQSALANVGTFDVLSKILSAMINIITGTTVLPESELFHKIFPWVGILYLPIIVLYFYQYISKKDGKFNGIDCILLYLFCVFPLAQQTFSISFSAGVDNAVARASMLLILVLFVTLFGDRRKSKNKLIILAFLFLAFFNYHHTFSYYLVAYLIILFLASRKINERHMANLAIYGIIISFASAIFYNTNLLEEPARLVNSFPQILVNFPSVSHTMQVNPDLFSYQSLGSTYSYMQYINSILILIISLIFFWRYIAQKKRGEPKLYEKILFYFLVAEFFIGSALFVVNGIWSVYARIFESLTYLSMLLAAFLLVKSERKLKTAVRLVLLGAITLCVISYPTSPEQTNLQLTEKEFKGISFAGKHIPKISYIFSDFSLGPSLIYYGQQGIKTIDAQSYPPEVTEEILVRCYYNVSNPEVILDKFIDSHHYYVVTSSRGVLDPSLQVFKPPSVNFEEKWGEQNAFNIVYSSGHFDIYERVG